MDALLAPADSALDLHERPSTLDERAVALDEIASNYDPSDPALSFDYWFKHLEARACAPWLCGNHVLELGGATGQLTSLLVERLAAIAGAVSATSADAPRYTVVEGSPLNCARLRERLPDIEVIEAFWEDYEPTERFSDIVLFEALEHYPHPVELLRRCTSWLRPGGRVLISVPNGRSLHRQVGVAMGLLHDPLELTHGDRAQGHLRNYDVESLRADVEAAGLHVLHYEGLFLKVVPNARMLDWPSDLINAIDEVAKQHSHLAAEILMVAGIDAHDHLR